MAAAAAAEVIAGVWRGSTGRVEWPSRNNWGSGEVRGIFRLRLPKKSWRMGRYMQKKMLQLTSLRLLLHSKKFKTCFFLATVHAHPYLVRVYVYASNPNG
jgi:hypothetical protein